MKEEILYDSVETLLKESSFRCFRTGQKKGTMFLGYADVIGVRDIGGDIQGELEIVAVEVKLGFDYFGRHLGQSLGYSIFANRCYLAIKCENEASFNIEHKELATRLGVGLIKITNKWGDWRAEEVLSSAQHVPIGPLKETLLRKAVGLVKCCICGFYVEQGKTSESWKKALKNGRTFISWRKPDWDLLFSRREKEDWRRMYVCHDCLTDFEKANKKQ